MRLMRESIFGLLQTVLGEARTTHLFNSHRSIIEVGIGGLIDSAHAALTNAIDQLIAAGDQGLLRERTSDVRKGQNTPAVEAEASGERVGRSAIVTEVFCFRVLGLDICVLLHSSGRFLLILFLRCHSPASCHNRSHSSILKVSARRLASMFAAASHLRTSSSLRCRPCARELCNCLRFSEKPAWTSRKKLSRSLPGVSGACE